MDDSSSVKAADAYDAWAPVYDRTFGALASGVRRRAVERLGVKPVDRVLDLGVGTGAMLDALDPSVRVVGVDLCESMLSRAKRRAGLSAEGRYLVRADAELPPFVDGAFDHVVMTHVVSVVSDPTAVMRWAARLVKPTGGVMVVNHFVEPGTLVGGVKAAMNPLFVRVGWRTDLSLGECLRGVPLSVEYSVKVSPMGLWRIVMLRPQAAVAPVVADEPRPMRVAEPEVVVDGEAIAAWRGRAASGAGRARGGCGARLTCGGGTLGPSNQGSRTRSVQGCGVGRGVVVRACGLGRRGLLCWG
ncbi:MAG: methyltransferase domain-containing protein [Planctomycetota bacterium]